MGESGNIPDVQIFFLIPFPRASTWAIRAGWAGEDAPRVEFAPEISQFEDGSFEIGCRADGTQNLRIFKAQKTFATLMMSVAKTPNLTTIPGHLTSFALCPLPRRLIS